MGVRSPSPATSQTLRQELNGHSSPAPSLYHSQSRRSSLTSLNESSEVISSHPKFVKDISKFWYKPTITRDEGNIFIFIYDCLFFFLLIHIVLLTLLLFDNLVILYKKKKNIVIFYI